MPGSKKFRVPISEPLKSKEPRAAISGSADKKTAAKKATAEDGEKKPATRKPRAKKAE
jgi:hypothetical protein